MLEHLRREGWITPVFGRLRPSLTALFYAELLVPELAGEVWLVSTLLAFAALTVVQVLLGRQRRPVATRKSVAVIAGVVALTIAAATALFLARLIVYLPLLVVLQPVLVVLSWCAFRPLDRFLKRRIIARARRMRGEHPDLVVVGITGSVGKTTTKELLAHILAGRGALATPAHVNADMGVANWLIQLLDRATSQPATCRPQILIVEMGAYRRGEIALLCSIARPTIGVVTHVGHQHLALFGSAEALAEAKSELVASLPPQGHAFLNGDSEWAKRMKDIAPCAATVVGTGGEADIEAFEIEETGEGIRFRALDTTFAVPLHGTHNVVNALLAIAVCRHLGMDLIAIRDRLRTFRPPSRTFSVRKEHGVTVLDDTHNSSPASFKAAIAWAKTQPFERKTLLAAGLIELGEEQERTHAELGGLAAGVFDRVVFLDARAAKEFERGYGKKVGLLTERPATVGAGELLVCVGRMPEITVQKIIHHS